MPWRLSTTPPIAARSDWCAARTLAVQSLNAVALGFERSFGAYLLGLILFLGLASMHFVALLVAVHLSDSRRDH